MILVILGPTHDLPTLEMDFHPPTTTSIPIVISGLLCSLSHHVQGHESHIRRLLVDWMVSSKIEHVGALHGQGKAEI